MYSNTDAAVCCSKFYYLPGPPLGTSSPDVDVTLLSRTVSGAVHRLSFSVTGTGCMGIVVSHRGQPWDSVLDCGSIVRVIDPPSLAEYFCFYLSVILQEKRILYKQ